MSLFRASIVLCVFFAVGLFSFPALAQIVTPSLDPTQPELLPTAASWRTARVISVSAIQSKSETKDDQGKVDSKETTDLQRLNIALLWSSLSVSGSAWQETSNNTEEPTESFKREYISYRFDEYYALGIMGQSDMESFDADAYGLAASMRFFEYLFVSYGLEEEKLEQLKWRNTYAGLSFYIVRALRLEYSRIVSPEASLDQTTHVGYERDYTSVELQLFDFVATGQQSRLYPGGDKAVDPYLTRELGLSYVPETGIAGTLRYHNTTYQNQFESTGWELGVGFLF